MITAASMPVNRLMEKREKKPLVAMGAKIANRAFDPADASKYFGIMSFGG